MTDKPESIDERARVIVARDVFCNVGGLVSRLAELEDGAAIEANNPVPDYDSAAIDAGWREIEGEWSHKDETELLYDGAQALCDDQGIEPHEREVFEHWAISSWLAARLEEQGERVDTDFYGLCVWSRTTTGQAVYADECIQQIAANALRDYAAMVARHNAKREA